MPRPGVQLLRIDGAVELALASDPDYRDSLDRNDWPRLATVMLRHVGSNHAAPTQTVKPAHWSGYCVVDGASGAVIGACGFKGPPRDDGTVEIAYFTYPGFEGRGYATQMAQALIDIARAAPEVRHIIAHTLPESNASTRILAKMGMTLRGEVMDPDDGRVWRWELM